MRLPSGAVTQTQAEGLWSQDRVSLAQCRASKQGLADFYAKRDGEIAR